ncbi:hypothetical protein FACS1894105_13330 [Clostridia bacterium]|nr:hypothetical protein FACS1894105_13330 [Clostridia bacterium]
MRTDNFQWLKGFNYNPSNSRNCVEFWRDYNRELVNREMEYAKRLGLNCARILLSYVVYKSDPGKFIGNLIHFVDTANSKGIKTIPAIWDSCFSEDEPSLDTDVNEWIPNPGVMYLGEKYWQEQSLYCDAIIEALENNPGLLVWDVHNEPFETSYIYGYKGEEKQRHFDEILAFTLHWCKYFHVKSTRPVTVGVAYTNQLEHFTEACDVLSFHDYSPTWQGIKNIYDNAVKIAQQAGKAVFCSEMCCAGRANPYDIAIQTANEKKVGYFLWELMIGRNKWSNICGIVYPDGTVRDPSIVAAILGFFHKRDEIGSDYNVNAEGVADRILARAENWLSGSERDYQEGLNITCVMANLVESGNLVPLNILPSAQYAILEKSNHEDSGTIEALISKWSVILRDDANKKR